MNARPGILCRSKLCRAAVLFHSMKLQPEMRSAHFDFPFITSLVAQSWLTVDPELYFKVRLVSHCHYCLKDNTRSNIKACSLQSSRMNNEIFCLLTSRKDTFLCFLFLNYKLVGILQLGCTGTSNCVRFLSLNSSRPSD